MTGTTCCFGSADGRQGPQGRGDQTRGDMIARQLANRTAAPRPSLGSLTVIEVQQPAKAFHLYHWPFLPPQPWVGKRNGIVDSLMIAFGVVMRQVLPDHMLQGAFAEQDELLHAFRLDGLHEPLRKRIQVRGVWRKFHDRDTGGIQDLVEGLGVFGVAVVDQVMRSDKFPLPPGHIPGDLLHPWLVRVLAHSSENDPTGSHVDEDQYVIGRQAPPRPNLRRDEIRRPQHFPVPTNEIAPCRIPSSLRRWPKAVSLEDVAHRLIADVVPQIVDRASNSVVAPRRIVSGQKSGKEVLQTVQPFGIPSVEEKLEGELLWLGDRGKGF